MAVVDLNTNEWYNNDGLLVKFDLDRVRPSRSGEYTRMADGQHLVSTIIDLATLPTAASGNEQILDDGVTIPAGAFITKVIVTVLEEPTTLGSPNLDLGLVKLDRSTEIDFNGLLAATDTWETGTDLGTVVEYVKGSTEVGALVGTQLAYTGYLTASPDTADWTDGTIKVDILFYMPLTADL